MPTAKYSLEDKKSALLELARVNGNLAEAERVTGITRKSLSQWRRDYYDYYRRASADRTAELEEMTVADLRERVNATNEVEAEVLDQLADRLRTEKLSATELANILQRVATVKGINADKLLRLTGKPAALPQGNVQELIASLVTKGIIEVDAQVVQKEKPALTNGPSFLTDGE